MSKGGVVFDIQRFSLHDGPGIRTTVFLKGCPLRCKWCHNPESWVVHKQLLYKKDSCENCMECTVACHANAHKKSDTGHHLDRSLCTACGKCVEVCKHGALSTSGKSMNTDEVLVEILKDRSYYNHSGGGLTLSGGEPMFQYDFCLELLKKTKEQGLHTCMETCGMALKEQYSEIVKYTDLFLFDIKETDESKHQAFTGVSNKLILSNLKHLCTSKAEIIIRCPLIPGLNDYEQNINTIAAIQRENSNIKRVEILPYHDYGKSKWDEIGYLYQLDDIKTLEQGEIAELIERFKNAGCTLI